MGVPLQFTYCNVAEFNYFIIFLQLPEVNHAAQEESKRTGKIWSIFFLQNAGLLLGYGFMIIMARYSKHFTIPL